MNSIQGKSRPVNKRSGKDRQRRRSFTVSSNFVFISSDLLLCQHVRGGGSGTPGYRHRDQLLLLRAGSSCRRPWIQPPFCPPVAGPGGTFRESSPPDPLQSVWFRPAAPPLALPPSVREGFFRAAGRLAGDAGAAENNALRAFVRKLRFRARAAPPRGFPPAPPLRKRETMPCCSINTCITTTLKSSLRL